MITSTYYSYMSVLHVSLASQLTWGFAQNNLKILPCALVYLAGHVFFCISIQFYRIMATILDLARASINSSACSSV